MRILFHIDSLNIGGGERQLTYLVKGLVELGWDVHVVTLYSGGRFWRELESWSGCKLHSLDRKSRWDFSVIAKLAHYIRKHDIDMIQGWQRPCNSFAGLAGWICRVPTCMSVRNSNTVDLLGAKIFYWLDQVLSRLAIVKKVTFNSHAGSIHHIGRGYPRKKSIVISNGIAVRRNDLFPEPFQHEAPWRIGMIARLDPMKDHEMMFEAMHLLLQQGAPVEMHLYGDGKEDRKRHLTHEAERQGIAAQVHWHGFTDDVWDVLAQLDIVSSSSSYGEGMSNTILEAMMAGRAVVATDVGDAKRMLYGEAGQCGIIVPAKDSKAMAEAISTILQDHKMAVSMAKKAREVVLEHYSIDAMITQYKTIFMKYGKNQ